MGALTVREFDSPSGADDAVRTLQDLAQQQLVTVYDAATVSSDGGGKKPTT